MNIREQIHIAKHVAAMKCEESAFVLYLGRNQDDALREEIQSSSGMPWRYDPAYVGTRRQYSGMDIYVVDAQDHLAVYPAP